jgi:hypothetical protein
MIAISNLRNSCAGEAAPFEAQGKQAVARCAVLNSQLFQAELNCFAPRQSRDAEGAPTALGGERISNWRFEISDKGESGLSVANSLSGK